MKLYWAKVKEDAVIPTKRAEDAGYDLYPCFDEDYMQIEPLETRLIPLGVCSAFDPGYVIFLKERGSTGTKGIAQRSGVIDSGFRGEYMCPVTNVSEIPLRIAKKASLKNGIPEGIRIYPYEKAIAQAVLLESPNAQSVEISLEELRSIPSLRKEGMLGSSEK